MNDGHWTLAELSVLEEDAAARSARAVARGTHRERARRTTREVRPSETACERSAAESTCRRRAPNRGLDAIADQAYRESMTDREFRQWRVARAAKVYNAHVAARDPDQTYHAALTLPNAEQLLHSINVATLDLEGVVRKLTVQALIRSADVSRTGVV